MNKVLFVSHTSDLATGPPKSLLLLLQHLRDRYEVAVLLRGEGRFADVLASEQIPFFSIASFTRWSIPSIFKLIRRGRFNLVYSNTGQSSSRHAFIAAKLARVPFVCHVREMAWGKSWLTHGHLRFSDAIVTVSEACAESFSRFASREKTHVVYNGVELSDDVQDSEAHRAYLLANTPVSQDDLVFAHLGSVYPRKGQKYSIAAMAAIRREVPKSHLLLIGSTDRRHGPAYGDQLKSMIRDENLENNVSILGFRSDARQLLSGADIFLHTPVTDPHPRAILEAMETRLPVVAFATDGIAETVVHGHTGYLVPQGDVSGLVEAAVTLAKNPLLRSRMGGEGRRRVETTFLASVTARKVAHIIDEQLARVNLKS